MSVIRRIISLRIVTTSLKQLKKRSIKRVKTRLKSQSLIIMIITVIIIRKTLS